LSERRESSVSVRTEDFDLAGPTCVNSLGADFEIGESTHEGRVERARKRSRVGQVRNRPASGRPIGADFDRGDSQCRMVATPLQTHTKLARQEDRFVQNCTPRTARLDWWKRPFWDAPESE